MQWESANSFCQGYQTLSGRRFRKAGFIAQQVLLLLFELAHNLIIWMKKWFIEAVEIPFDTSKKTQNAHRKTKEMLEKQLRRNILAIPGKVCIEKGTKVVGGQINPLYSLGQHITTATKYFSNSIRYPC